MDVGRTVGPKCCNDDIAAVLEAYDRVAEGVFDLPRWASSEWASSFCAKVEQVRNPRDLDASISELSDQLPFLTVSDERLCGSALAERLAWIAAEHRDGALAVAKKQAEGAWVFSPGLSDTFYEASVKLLFRAGNAKIVYRQGGIAESMAQSLEGAAESAMIKLDASSLEDAVPIGVCLGNLVCEGGREGARPPEHMPWAGSLAGRVLLGCSETIRFALARSVGHYLTLSKTRRVGFFLFDDDDEGKMLKGWIRSASVFGDLVGSDAVMGLRKAVEESMRSGWLPKHRG